MFPGEEAAGGINVFTAGSPYSTCDSVIIQSLHEPLHHRGWRRLEGRIRYLVEPDQVDTAFKAAKEAVQGIRMDLVVVNAGKHRILETHPPLAGEVIPPDERNDFGNRPGLLDRHHAKPFVRKRIMEADCQVAPGRFQVLPEIGDDTYGGERNAFR